MPGQLQWHIWVAMRFECKGPGYLLDFGKNSMPHNEKHSGIIITTSKGADMFSHIAPSAFVDFQIVDAATIDRSARLFALTSEWDVLRKDIGLETRFNSPAAFLNRLRKYQNCQYGMYPFAILDSISDRLACVVVGEIGRDKRSHRVGPMNFRSVNLTKIRVGESGVIHNAQQERLTRVFDGISRLLSERSIDVFEILNVRRKTQCHEILCLALGKWRTTQREKNRWQAVLVDSETGERLVRHSSKTRNTLRRKDKKLAHEFDGDLFVETVSKAEQIDYFIHEASKIVSQSYQAGLGIGVREGDEAFRDYLYELAAEGVLRSYVLRGKGRPIAYVHGDLQGGVYCLWATSYLEDFKEFSPGIVLLNRVLNTLADEGVEVFDFGWGDAAYKEMLGNRRLETVDLRFFRRGWRSSLEYWVDRSLLEIDRRLRLFLHDNGMFNSLRSIWRNSILKRAR